MNETYQMLKKMFYQPTKVVEVLQDQRSRAPVPSPQQSIMSLGVLTLYKHFVNIVLTFY